MKAGRRLVLALAIVMLIPCLAGCGSISRDSNTGDVNDADGAFSENGNSASNIQQGDEMVVGRYVEEEIKLADETDWYGSGLHKLSDGRIVLSNKNRAFLISEDNGATWKEDEREWHTRMLTEGRYAFEIVIGADNTAAVIYNDGVYDPDAQKYTGKDRLLVVRPDGTENLIEMPAGKADISPQKVAVADDGRILFSVSDGGDLYEVKSDGSCQYFMTAQCDYPKFMRIQGKLLFLDASDDSYPLIYDMDKQEYVEDDVLIDFLKENYPEGNSYNGTGTYQRYLFPEEEGVIYIAGKKGLHRHVLGGSAMEQIIDGSRCTLGDPSYAVKEIIMTADHEFLILFGGDRLHSSEKFGGSSAGRLIRYAYDPDAVSASAGRLKVYSLKENDTIRQAVALFLTAYPDIAVEYEVGMEAGSSVTREDALKNLNTRIMAGQGPDVLILDDMPMDSYLEKGMLLDLGTILRSLNGEEAVFDSIVQAMKKEGQVPVMPCEIQLPVMMGEEKYISQMKDLESTADMMEELRRDNPGKDLLNICSEKGIMRYFAMSCVPAWTTDSGDLDTEAVAQFLRQTKRIYDAQMDGLPESAVEEYHLANATFLEYQGISKEDAAIFRTDDNVIMYVGGLRQLAYCALSSAGLYDTMVSVNKVNGFETNAWTVMNGQSSNVFCAKTLLGITATTQNIDPAEKFIKLCLGKEVQSNLFYGLAVNQAVFDEKFHVEDIVERFVYLNGNEEGTRTEMQVYPSDETQIAALREQIEAADTPYIEDSVLENAVYEGGIPYIRGEQSLEEAVAEIEKKIWIYMAE